MDYEFVVQFHDCKLVPLHELFQYAKRYTGRMANTVKPSNMQPSDINCIMCCVWAISTHTCLTGCACPHNAIPDLGGDISNCSSTVGDENCLRFRCSSYVPQSLKVLRDEQQFRNFFSAHLF